MYLPYIYSKAGQTLPPTGLRVYIFTIIYVIKKAIYTIIKPSSLYHLQIVIWFSKYLNIHVYVFVTLNLVWPKINTTKFSQWVFNWLAGPNDFLNFHQIDLTNSVPSQLLCSYMVNTSCSCPITDPGLRVSAPTWSFYGSHLDETEYAVLFLPGQHDGSLRTWGYVTAHNRGLIPGSCSAQCTSKCICAPWGVDRLKWQTPTGCRLQFLHAALLKSGHQLCKDDSSFSWMISYFFSLWVTVAFIHCFR